MAQEIITIATGDAVGTDKASGTDFQRATYWRRITGLRMAGGAAAADTEIEIRVGKTKMGTFKNKATGYPTRDHHSPCNIPIPPMVDLHVVVTDAANTNSAYVEMDVNP